MKHSKFKTTEYTGIGGIYLRRILKTIISIGDLDKRNLRVLDFGGGHGMLKKLLPGVEVINYDIIKELSDVDDWKSVSFDIVVANAVFYLFNENDLLQFINDLHNKNNKVELIVGISRQSWLNNIGKILLGRQDAHDGTKTPPNDEICMLKSKMEVIRHKSVFMLADIWVLKFKNENQY